MEKIPEINFVKKQKTKIKIRSKRTQLINSLSFFSLAIYTSFLIGLISYSGILSLRLSSLSKKVNKEGQAIESLSDIESKYLVLKEKTSSVLAMTSSVYQHQNLIEEIFNLFPTQLSVDGFTVDSKNIVSFEAQTNSPKTMFEFINNVNQYNLMKNNKKIVMADIGKLSINANGDYNFSVNLKVVFL